MSRKNELKKLEDTLFDSFIQAIDVHRTRYDSVAGKEAARLRDLTLRKKESLLSALKSYDSQDGYHVPDQLDDFSAREFLAQKIVEALKEDIPHGKSELIEAITRDALTFYKEAFFQRISQDNQLWIIFRESLKITSISEVVKELQRTIPSREEFEAIRSHVIGAETNSDTIQKLKREYLEYLTRKYSSIELTGVSPRVHGQDISFMLKDIFIPFDIESHRLGRNSPKKLKVATRDLPSLFREDEPHIADKTKLLKNLAQFSQVVLLGDPGGGKTTLLKYIAYQMSIFQKEDRFLPFYVPIFLRVSEYAQVLKHQPSKRLLEFLINDYDKQFSSLYKWAFDNCQVLLLLDGLDEVLSASQRLKVVEEVKDIIARMPENRYIITSRVVGYDQAKLGEDFKHFTIKKFNRFQIRAFCHSWYDAVSKKELQGSDYSREKADKLYRDISSKKAVEDLACNPLMVTLIANMHFKGQNLPCNRVHLYDIATETLLQYWVQHRVADEGQLKDKDDISEILSPISFYIHETSPEGLISENEFREQCRAILNGEEYDFTHQEIKTEIKELIRFLREQSGFFHEKGIDKTTGISLFGFLHQTFQEYFASIEIVNQWKEESLDFSDMILNPRWTESIRLAAGVLNMEKGRSRKKSATKFVSDLLNASSFSEEALVRGMSIVSLILSDEIYLTPTVQENFFRSLIKIWDEESTISVRNEIETHIAILLDSKHSSNITPAMK